ncbi:hypothetical protein D9758_010348 [Tetrapyrgos nigripes]|uniref:Uncharacterized protein n=1 Tax=Tetrapyrgos nigripes TaxID=182062 RepID=A0A8H5D245_9AGAR|nr:hypothetical protein D9758_010348 [Tetrapyrgos nigripes]
MRPRNLPCETLSAKQWHLSPVLLLLAQYGRSSVMIALRVSSKGLAKALTSREFTYTHKLPGLDNLTRV